MKDAQPHPAVDPGQRPRAVVDHELCAGVSQCLRAAPGAFQLDEHLLSVFVPTGEYTLDELEQAAEFCPMGAISLVDGIEVAGD